MSQDQGTRKSSRRSFLTKISAGLLGGGIIAGIWPYFRSLFPNVLYEPPKKFKIGVPDDFTQGVVFLDSHKLFVFRDGNAFYAISAICTHLGCTVKYHAFKQEKEMKVRGLQYRSRGEFLCPCHGSKFRDEGTNYAGPAPRPLPWHPLEIAPQDGQLIVDISKKVDRNFRLVV
jgi:menaquinol-cytochrome c reductase iron-sulfur subunit